MMERVRTLTMLVFGAAAILAGCDGGEAVPSAPAEPKAAQTVGGGEPPRCRRTNIASDDYGTEVHPASGASRTEVTISGTTRRGEDWRWAPSDRLEAWWNTDVPDGAPIEDGPVLRLVRVDDMERCRFKAVFRVPDVEPGRYRISVFVWEKNPADGYGYFLPHGFTVLRE